MREMIERFVSQCLDITVTTFYSSDINKWRSYEHQHLLCNSDCSQRRSQNIHKTFRSFTVNLINQDEMAADVTEEKKTDKTV